MSSAMRPLLGKPRRISLLSVILLSVLSFATVTCSGEAEKQVTVARGFTGRTRGAGEWKEIEREGGASAETEDSCCGVYCGKRDVERNAIEEG